MSYQTQRSRIKDFIEKRLFHALTQKDLDYNRVLDTISSEIGCSKNMVEDMLSGFIASKKIKEMRILTIPDEKVDDWLKENIKIAKENKEELKRGLDVLKEVKNGTKKQRK